MLRGGHEPGTRVVRDARLRPPFERGDERLLREVLGQSDVAHDSRESGDEPRRLDPPDRVDRAMGVGSRHGCRSHHLQFRGARRPWNRHLTAAPLDTLAALAVSSISMAMWRHLPCRNRSTLSMARVKWPRTIANQMSLGRRPRIACSN